MSTWAKALIVAFVGGFLGQFGGEVQLSCLESLHLVGDNVTRQYMLSADMGAWLGLFTGAALIYRQDKQFKATACLCLIGGLSCLLWLLLDHDSQVHQWLSGETGWGDVSWSARVLLFNGVPVLWSGVLLWCGLRLLHREFGGLRKGTQIQPEPA